MAEATLREIEQAIEALGHGTEEYHEAVGMYCLTLARSQWRIAERIRARRLAKERGEVRAR